MSLNLTSPRIAVAAVVAAFALAGCGGDDDTTDTTAGASGASGVSGTALTEDEFTSQVNGICGDVNDQIEALQAPTNDPQSLADFAQEGLDIVEPAFEQFQAITPPADLQSQWDEFLSHAQKQIDLEKQLQSAAAAGDIQQVKELAAEIKANEDDSLS